MNVALVCIVKNENDYLKEYVEYYHNLGVDKIFILDNNTEEDPKDVLSGYSYVEIINYRGYKKYQNQAYNEVIHTRCMGYDWVCVFDADELLYLQNHKNIKDYLSCGLFYDYNCIMINWHEFDDNDLIGNENNNDRNMFKRFSKGKEHVYKMTDCKSIVRPNEKLYYFMPHVPAYHQGLKLCNNKGEAIRYSHACLEDYTLAELRHYRKTIIEFIEHKLNRGWADGQTRVINFDWFFEYHKKTPEKLKIMEDYLHNNNLDIFICTHKEFKPVVHNSCYKIINANSINNDMTDNGIKGSFYSEILSYLYVNKNYTLKDYIGFCSYRKYFSFMDNIPNMTYIFKDFEVITTTPLVLNCSVKKHYDKCHNADDLKIVEEIIREKYQEYYDTFQLFVNSNKISPCNMFIMKKEDFVRYCNFIEGVLNEYLTVIGWDIEKRIRNNKAIYLRNNTFEYQYRIGGYLAERLTNVFILNNFKKIKYYDISQLPI